MAAARINEAWLFLQERLKPQDFSPRGEGQEMKRKQKSIELPIIEYNEKFNPFHYRHNLGVEMRFVVKKSRSKTQVEALDLQGCCSES